MSTRTTTIVLAAIVAAAFLIALLRPAKQRSSINEAPVLATNADQASPASPTQRGHTEAAPSSSTNQATSSQSVNPSTNGVAGMGKSEAVQGILSDYNDVPIDFYGKLEDQFGNPVPEAQIKGGITVINGTRRGTDWLTETSDAAGLFSFHGKGQDIGLMPQKQGYVLATTQTLFKYSRLEDHPYSSDPSNPTIIRMRRLQGAQPLVSFDIKAYVPVDGTPVQFNLQTGAPAKDGGDLTLRLESPLRPNPSQGYDWKAILQVIDGGIMQPTDTNPDQMLEAPETGYTTEFDITRRNTENPWSSRFRDSFYFSSRGGRFYGRLTLSITTDVVKDGGALVALSGYLNPSSSRVLEIDPALITQAHP